MKPIEEDYVIILEDRRNIESEKIPGNFFVLGYDKWGRVLPKPYNETDKERLMIFKKNSPLMNLFKSGIRTLLGSKLFRMFQAPKLRITESISKLRESIKEGRFPENNNEYIIPDRTEYSMKKEDITPFTKESLPRETLESLGIDVETFLAGENYQKLLNGERTSLIGIKVPFGGGMIDAEVKLQLIRNESEYPSLVLINKLKEPQLDVPYKGLILTEEDKANLLETGNLGRLVELRNSKGELYPAYVSLDSETNRLISVDARGFEFPKEIGGVTLTKAQQWALREGEEVELRGISDENGKKRIVTVQFNAEQQTIEARYGRKTRLHLKDNMLQTVSEVPKELKNLSTDTIKTDKEGQKNQTKKKVRLKVNKPSNKQRKCRSKGHKR